MRAIICKNIDEFNTLERRIFQCKIDSDHSQGTRWAHPIFHPDKREEVAFLCRADIEKFLEQDELDRIVELAADWFPEPKEMP